MTRQRAAVWSALALLIASSGCHSYPGAPDVSGSMEEATVKGTVRVRGQPVNNGTVTFRTANVRRPTAPWHEAPIGKDGTYTVQTLVGENYIEVSCKELNTPQNRQLLDNERMVKIQSGENTLDIDLPPQAATQP
jgi:hypothetical protein